MNFAILDMMPTVDDTIVRMAGRPPEAGATPVLPGMVLPPFECIASADGMYALVVCSHSEAVLMGVVLAAYRRAGGTAEIHDLDYLADAVAHVHAIYPNVPE